MSTAQVGCDLPDPGCQWYWHIMKPVLTRPMPGDESAIWKLGGASATSGNASVGG